MNVDNKELARVLSETADLMEIAGEDGFRIRSYRNGATAIEGYPESIAAILKDPERKVTDIPASAKGWPRCCARSRRPALANGAMSCWRSIPPTALEFLKIQGLGPKSIALLFEHFQITTMDELEQLCRDQKLRDLPRMGAKLEEKVLRSIAQYKLRTGRFLLSFAQQTADELIAYLSGDGIESIMPAGSLRRGRETVGDLDLLVTGPNAAAALERMATHPRVHEVLARREQDQRQVRPRRPAGGCARAAARELRRGDAVFHGQQGAQRRAAAARGPHGTEAERVRAVPRRGRSRKWRATTEEEVYEALGLAGFRRRCARISARSNWRRKDGCRELVELEPDPRRSAHAHHRDRRPRDAGGDGRSGARSAATNTSRSRTIRSRSR